MSISIKNESAWKFVTSAGSTPGFGFLAAGGGMFVLTSPHTGQDETFYFGGAGAGLSINKFPGLDKLKLQNAQKVTHFKGEWIVQEFIKGSGFSVAYSKPSFPSYGSLWITDWFSGTELKTSDIQGPCLYMEAGAGAIRGFSGMLMFVGLNPIVAGMMLTGNPISLSLYLMSKGVLRMAGLNTGLQLGGGVSCCLGYVH